MIKFIITYLFEFLVLITVITQIVGPMFIKELPFFWFFKKTKQEEKCEDTPASLEDLEKEATESTEKYVSTVEKVDKTLEKTQAIKKKTIINK